MPCPSHNISKRWTSVVLIFQYFPPFPSSSLFSPPSHPLPSPSLTFSSIKIIQLFIRKSKHIKKEINTCNLIAIQSSSLLEFEWALHPDPSFSSYINRHTFKWKGLNSPLFVVQLIINIFSCPLIIAYRSHQNFYIWLPLSYNQLYCIAWNNSCGCWVVVWVRLGAETSAPENSELHGLLMLSTSTLGAVVPYSFVTYRLLFLVIFPASPVSALNRVYIVSRKNIEIAAIWLKSFKMY